MEETPVQIPMQPIETAPKTPIVPTKSRSRMLLWTILVIVGALLLMSVATFFALRIVADNAAHDYKQKLAAYETSLAKSFNGSADSRTLASAISSTQLPSVAAVPVPMASLLYQQVAKQSGSVDTTVNALKQSVNDYAALNAFLNSYLDLENQEGTLVTKITIGTAGVANIESIQGIVAKKQALIKSMAVPNESAGTLAVLDRSLQSKATALNQLMVAAKARDYSGFNAATATINTASQKEETALSALDTQASALQDSINQNVTAFNQLVAKVVQ